jgi:hypothetical protein
MLNGSMAHSHRVAGCLVTRYRWPRGCFFFVCFKNKKALAPAVAPARFRFSKPNIFPSSQQEGIRDTAPRPRSPSPGSSPRFPSYFLDCLVSCLCRYHHHRLAALPLPRDPAANTQQHIRQYGDFICVFGLCRYGPPAAWSR